MAFCHCNFHYKILIRCFYAILGPKMPTERKISRSARVTCNEKHLILLNFSDVHVLLIFMQPLKHHDEPRRKISAPAYRPGRRDSVVAVHTNRRASVAAPRRFNRRGSEVSIQYHLITCKSLRKRF